MGAAPAAAMARWVCGDFGRCRQPPFIGGERGNDISIHGGPLGAARRRHLPRLRRRQVPLRGLPSVPPRKQRHLDELQDSTALLRRGNRDLAARAEAAQGGLALALLANAVLRAEAAALSRRLAAARRALVILGRVYARAAAVASVDGNCCLGSRRRGWPRRATTARGCVGAWAASAAQGQVEVATARVPSPARRWAVEEEEGRRRHVED
ncbi:uncharacterized protein [Miscanthus floridulus]|uniref:uncharacterized protein n=1 Tax=Miscanthus floridulus TaxID=154761 RepID=UPI00345A17E3